jgi:hypothetical protein
VIIILTSSGVDLDNKKVLSRIQSLTGYASAKKFVVTFHLNPKAATFLLVLVLVIWPIHR